MRVHSRCLGAEGGLSTQYMMIIQTMRIMTVI